ncbi:hypothetical protein BWI17_01525 [Betaproteobacteria bacterium GR16-43]|nr:hypothetical protein BWI17_01525 [Betaproteobacteria bacterium GR16-43]
MSEGFGAWRRRADFFLQPYVRLTREVYADATTSWGADRATRTAPWRDEDRYGSDAAYRNYLSSIHEAKIRSVESLAAAFDFARYPRVLELGCGDMPQAFTIATRFPAVHYTATDFDPLVIEHCSRLPMLEGIRKSVLDVRGGDREQVRHHDLVTSWTLEFSLEDAELANVFAACRESGVPYLLCTHATLGPIGWLSGRPPVAEAGSKRLGSLRSVGRIAQIARAAGMSLRWKAYHVNHAALFFAP